jgi:hypothetical protein
MAANLQPLPESKEIVSQLLTEKSLVRELYKIIQNAAVNATTSKSVIDDSHNTCAYPIGSPALSRTDECSISKRYHVSYHPEDILIVGGMAVSLYDEAISGIKSRYHNTSTLQRYVEKDTTDIDLVWWPRIKDTTPYIEENVVTINSPAISTLVTKYVSELNMILTNKKDIEIIENIIHGIRPDITLVRIEIEESSIGIKAGAKKILIYFIITIPENQTEIKLEICDISIHDGASSQKAVDAISNKLILQPMMLDPMYCLPYVQTVSFPLSRKKNIYMPHIISIIKQQLLAFKNLLDANNEKCLINYKRIRYLQLMIFEYYHQKKNTNIHKIFKIPINSIDLLRDIDSNLEKIIGDACYKQNSNGSQLCQIIKRLNELYHFQLQSFRNIHERKQMQYAYQLQQHMQQIQLQQQQLQQQQMRQQQLQQQQMRQQQMRQQQMKQHFQDILHEPILSVKKEALNNHDVCTLPNTIEYMMGKYKIIFNLEDKSEIKLKIETVYPLLCKYYHLLDRPNLNTDGKEQFKRVKQIIHDIFEDRKKETIERRIESEAKFDPLKRLLFSQQGGFISKKQTRRKQTRRKQTRRKHHRKNKTHKR